LLNSVRPTPFRRALVVGSIAASATAGALVGFGLRQGTPLRPFNAVARLLLGARADGVWGFDPVVTLVGALLHVTVMLAWGFLCVGLAGTRRGIAAFAAAVGVTLAALAVDLLVVERGLHAGLSGVLSSGQVVVLHLVLLVALALGMRFASPAV
jgi:hypothetical protein